MIIAKKRGYPAGGLRSGREKWTLFVDALWGLMTPVLILGGIFSGLLQSRAAAAIAVAYSCSRGAVRLQGDLQTALRTRRQAGGYVTLVMFIIATAKVFGWGLALLPDSRSGRRNASPRR